MSAGSFGVLQLQHVGSVALLAQIQLHQGLGALLAAKDHVPLQVIHFHPHLTTFFLLVLDVQHIARLS